jgi:hypothetical protein
LTAIHLPGSEIKIPAQKVAKRWGKKVNEEVEEGGRGRR